MYGLLEGATRNTSAIKVSGRDRCKTAIETNHFRVRTFLHTQISSTDGKFGELLSLAYRTFESRHARQRRLANDACAHLAVQERRRVSARIKLFLFTLRYASESWQTKIINFMQFFYFEQQKDDRCREVRAFSLQNLTVELDIRCIDHHQMASAYRTATFGGEKVCVSTEKCVDSVEYCRELAKLQN